MANADRKADSKSPERGTSSCVAPGFNPGRCSETNQRPETSNRRRRLFRNLSIEMRLVSRVSTPRGAADFSSIGSRQHLWGRTPPPGGQRPPSIRLDDHGGRSTVTHKAIRPSHRTVNGHPQSDSTLTPDGQRSPTKRFDPHTGRSTVARRAT